MEKSVLYTPVLFLVFNRPEKTQRVFDIIKRVKPQKLYVAADAPREGNQSDTIGCEEVRKIVKQVDWECETHYLFHEKNLGCTLAGKTAWDWFFSQEDRMIFIEDDGFASDSFFFYCQELLEKYKDNDKLAYIGGVNYMAYSGNASYFFSRYCPPTYGMATWKRVYELYDYDMKSYETIRNSYDFVHGFWWKFERDLFRTKYDRYVNSVKEGKRENTYDVQMSYLCWRYHKYNIHPNANLVANIGFDYDGSNTIVDPNSSIAQFFSRPNEDIKELVHPSSIMVSKEDERNFFIKKVLLGKNYYFSTLKFYFNRELYKVKSIIKRCIGR